MKHLLYLAFSLALFAIAPAARAQQFSGTLEASGTPHGIEVTWTAGGQGSDGNAVAGSYVFRCTPGTGSCSTSTALCATPAVEPCWTNLTPSVNTAPNLLDPASDTGLAAGTTYAFAAQTVDITGDVSAFSNITTVAVPSAGFPANPNAPTGAAAKVQ
jgi:hypothetical protein